MTGTTSASSSASTLQASRLWQCPICLDTLDRPVLTTCCGQSFCQTCLDNALLKVDACPMCREPLLSGKHAMTRNRALEELLGRMQHVQTESEGESSEHQVLITIKDDGVEHESDTDEPTDKRSFPRRIYDRLLHVQRRTQQVLSSIRLQQWRHWCRIHWATLQCVFYVLLFGALVFFLRVQEEDYAEHSHRLMH